MEMVISTNHFELEQEVIVYLDGGASGYAKAVVVGGVAASMATSAKKEQL
ncbi:MAG TPA: hypothetical protein VFD33_05895 [Bacillota bacterium]|nr:hypothetical protein [Bacillota bacterium]